MAYTNEQVAELKDGGTWDYVKATAFAEKYGLKPRSVVATITALNLPYKAKEKAVAGTKKAKGPSKADLVADLEAVTGLRLPSADKMNMDDLRALVAHLEG